MLTITISIIPILVTTVCLLSKRGTSTSIMYGIEAGILLYLFQNGISFKNVLNICSIFLYTFFENAIIISNILLLFILVYLIQNSKIIDVLNEATEHYMESPVKIIVFLIIFGIVFSLDDYLSCMATGAVLTSAAKKQGFSNEKTACMINITAVSCCCLSPFSSWMPVIKSSLRASGLDENIIYQTIPYNYVAILGIALVIIFGFAKQSTFHTTFRKKNIAKKGIFKRILEYPEMRVFSIVLISLIGTLSCMTFIIPCSNALVKSTFLSIIISIFLFRKVNAITLKQIVTSIKSAVASTWDLCKLLISIWILTNVCNLLLNLGNNITSWASSVIFPYSFLPIVIYILSSTFAFLTGSAYGTFGLFIPLAVQISAGSHSLILQTLSIAAVVSGSLLAASSFSSDTLKLSAKSTNSDISSLQFLQLPYGVILFILSAIGFLLSGITAKYGKIISIISPLLFITLLLSIHFILLPKVLSFAYSLNFTYFRPFIHRKNMCARRNVYVTDKATFHKQYLEAELILQAIQKMKLKRIEYLEFIPSYPRKIPGL